MSVRILVLGFWYGWYLTRGLIGYLSESSIRLSIYFSLIVKLRSNEFLEPTNTRILLKATGAFDGVQINNWLITSQTHYPLRHVPTFILVKISNGTRICKEHNNTHIIWLDYHNLKRFPVYLGPLGSTRFLDYRFL